MIRYIAVDAITRKVVEWSVPLENATPTHALSAAGFLSAKIAPDVGQLRRPDGILVLAPYATLIYEEDDDQITWGGIVTLSGFVDDEWTIEANSHASYLHGLPYLGEFYADGIDPADVVREIWRHAQSFPDSDLGITVMGSTTQKIGTESDAKAQAAVSVYDAALAVYKAERDKLAGLRDAATAEREVYSARVATRTAANKDKTAATKALTAARRDGSASAIAAATAALATATAAAAAAVNAAALQAAVVDQRAAAVDAQAPVVVTAKAKSDAANKAKKAATKEARDDGGAYKLLAWETPDCGQSVDELASSTPFDWVERHRWDGDTIRSTIEIAYPRAGRKRTDLTFVLGQNVMGSVDLSEDGDDYASEVFGIGAGEGEESLRRSTATRTGRLRRVSVLSAKDVKAPSALDARMRRELDRLVEFRSIPSINVIDHPNARIGSWSLGDDILVEFTAPWVGDVADWYRVVGWTRIGEHGARLDLERTNTFTYGG